MIRHDMAGAGVAKPLEGDSRAIASFLITGAGIRASGQFSIDAHRTRLLQQGQHLFRAGDSCSSLYIVYSGMVKVFFTSEEGDEQVLGFFLPGEILGLETVKSRYHDCSAVALETSSICQLPVSHLDRLSRNLLDMRNQLTRLYTAAIARDYAALRILGKKGADQRLAGFLLDLSERFAERGFSAYEFNLSMSRRDIGDYLGLALGTVSRLFSEFESDGLLSVCRRSIRIKNIDGLRVLADNVKSRRCGACPGVQTGQE